ncbi:MAG: tetratricopeptide repeat protein [Polyangiaceae bacterium]|nr:tetratricopeptide repeat protein [Polyangiaceae bacterium]
MGKPGTVPSWLPAYSREQLALLEPGNEPVPVPALRTYPDPALFRYSHDRVLSDPRDAMRTTKLVADIVSESPRTYTVTEATPRIANDVAQYGPPPAREPDIWLVAKRDPAGRLQLVSAEVSKEAKEAYDEGHEALKKGRAAEAVKALRGAVRLAPSAPPLHLELGRALVANKQLDAAEAEFREVIHLDPTLSFGHEELASLLHQRGDVYGARTSIAHALAYHPNEEGALDLASKIAPTPGERPVPFSIFLEVDPMGVVRVASGPTVGARMYAGCRAVMRYEPELREALFGVGPNDPYFLSVAEEMFCIESAIGAFVAERAVARDEGRSAPEDTQTSALTGLAHTEGLLGFVMYEILGRHRPEHARTAPAAVHRATVRYVQQHILNYDPGPNPTNYVASAR